ncbi:MAG TPA: M20 family metallopeptidase, partial [Ktedonobacteraceae bacterium]|nr:M20 family metallopeptidase [Ktedonobacteraceae bacterium]
LLAKRMDDLGMEATLIERQQWGNDLYGVAYGQGGSNVLLITHMDTVYPVGTASAHPVLVEDETMYGPGVSDMKGGILNGLYAIQALLVQGYRSFGEIRLLCVSDEEIPVRHCRDIIRKACRGSQAALVLESARANGALVSARKGRACYTLTAHGHAAHAGVEPEKGRNAIIELAHQLLQFESLNGWREGLSINPGVIMGGTMSNVVPDYAQINFDVRYLRTEDRIALEERWHEMMQEQRVPGVELSLEVPADYGEPLVLTPAGLKLAEKAQEIAALLSFSVDHVATGGGSDGNIAAQYGIPVLDGLGPVGGLDHSPDEYLLINSVAPRTALLVGLIASIGATTVFSQNIS